MTVWIFFRIVDCLNCAEKLDLEEQLTAVNMCNTVLI